VETGRHSPYGSGVSCVRTTVCYSNTNRLCKEACKPRQGPVFDKHQLARTRYRKRIRKWQRRDTMSYTTDLHETLLTKDTPTF